MLCVGVVDLFGGASSLGMFKRSPRYEALEEAVSLLRSKGVDPGSVLQIVSRAEYCNVIFMVGDVEVSFDTLGFEDLSSDQLIVELSLKFSNRDKGADKEWSYIFKAKEFELLSRMLKKKLKKHGEER